MSEVTIKGRITTTELRAGEEATVEYTEHIDDLIERGYVVKVRAKGADGLTDLEREADAEAQRVKDELGVPSDDDTREVWRKFLSDKGIAWNQGDTKAVLIEKWRTYDPADEQAAVEDA